MKLTNYVPCVAERCAAGRRVVVHVVLHLTGNSNDFANTFVCCSLWQLTHFEELDFAKNLVFQEIEKFFQGKRVPILLGEPAILLGES